MCSQTAAAIRVAGFLTASVLAIDSANPQTPSSFGAQAEAVIVDVVVLGPDGKPVSSLTRDDFLLTEDGTPQQIATFEAVETHRTALAAPQPTTSPARTAMVVAAPTARRTLMIVFDDVGLGPAEGERARAALADFVRTEVASGDLVGLVSTSGEVRWMARTETEVQDLLDVVARLRGRATTEPSTQQMTEDEACRVHLDHDSRALTQVADRYRAAGMGNVPKLDRLVEADAGAVCQRASTRARQTLVALERAASSLGGLHGRKAVILVSPGFLSVTAVPEYRRVVEACREANVVVYLLSATGLEPPPGGPDVQLISPSLLPDSLRPRVEMEADQEEVPESTQLRPRAAAAGADNLAVDTGGFVVRNTNDIAGGLRRAAEDARAYYLLGYTPTNTARDGKYRKIAVRLARHHSEAHLTLRARRGYYGPSDTTPNRKVSVEEELHRLLDSPVERGDIPVHLAAFVLEDSTKTPGAIRCVLVSEVDGRVALLPERSHGDTVFDLAYETLPRGGGRSEHALKRVKVTGAGPSGRWIRVEQEFTLPPGVHQATVAVRNVAGRSASRTLRVEVPPTGAFRISTPIVAAWSGTGTKAQPYAAPAGRREFTSGDHVEVAFDVYGARKDPASGRPRVSMGCAVVRADQGARTAALRPVGQDQQDALHRTVDFELAGVGEGDYLFIGRVSDEIAGQQVTFSAPFAVTALATTRPAEETATQPTADPEVASLLELAGRYVIAYEEALHDLVAEEEYTQHAPSGTSPETSVSSSMRPGMTPVGGVVASRSPSTDSGPDWRRTRADVVFVRLLPPFPWATFRDVFEVNGAPVRAREGRLERAFRDSPRTAVAQAQVILAESARYNIGPERTINLPTLSLLFLHPSNQPRFAFERRGKGDGGVTIELAFREQSRPTMVRGLTGSTIQADSTAPHTLQGGGNLPAEGRFWINASRGTVLRSEVRWHFEFGGTATIETTYRAEPSLAMWVPAEMKERYEGGGFGLGADAVARYSRFRKFQVTTDEKARIPEK